MHVALLALTLVAMSGSPAVTQTALAPLPHLRPLDPLAVDLVSAGTRGSSTFAELLATLDHASGLVVYVTTTPSRDHRGSIVFVGHASGVTYLLIRVNTRQLDLDRVAVLAHALTHAVAISRASPPITSDRELQHHLHRRGLHRPAARIGGRGPRRARVTGKSARCPAR
jgi:hypothetical protein